MHRDLGGLSHKLFLLQEDDDRCTETGSYKLFLLQEDDDLCTGTHFNLVAFWSQIFYCGRRTIGVPGLGVD